MEFSFNLIRAKRFPSFMAIIGNLAGAQVIDKHTVRVTFKAPSSNSMRFIGTAPSIPPKHISSNIADPVNYPNLDNPIGSGPCVVADRREGQFITLKNTGTHYRSNLSLDTITLRVLRDETMGILSIRRGGRGDRGQCQGFPQPEGGGCAVVVSENPPVQLAQDPVGRYHAEKGSLPGN